MTTSLQVFLINLIISRYSAVNRNVQVKRSEVIIIILLINVTSRTILIGVHSGVTPSTSYSGVYNKRFSQAQQKKLFSQIPIHD